MAEQQTNAGAGPEQESRSAQGGPGDGQGPGSAEPVPGGGGSEPGEPGGGAGPGEREPVLRSVLSWLNSAGVTIAVLLALLGFAVVIQVKSTSTDGWLSAARLQDLVRIQSDLEAREQRLRQEITSLEESQRQLSTGAQRRQAALEEATRRADELGILAGTLPAQGPGLSLRFVAGTKPIKASVVLDAVQELRGAGAEAMEISGRSGAPVRIIASTYFLDGDGGMLNVDGRYLAGPYSIVVIGDPTTMRTALKIPGGVVELVTSSGGNVLIEEREVVDVTALSEPRDLQYARPVS
ncbi:MAG TPA: DUF881 domain-containing protein [Micromonosporaceae bacterium]|nr:DUF881 domain-containing protein [Micromonosporaceae bacterium]